MSVRKWCGAAGAVIAGFAVSPAMAEIAGDINGDNQIDLIESVYALRVASESTGAEFSSDDLVGNTFYEVNRVESINETCIIELTFTADTVHTKEWLYANDDSWIAGCSEEYVPDDEADIAYVINEGVIELTIPDEGIWEISLVERFEDNFLTSSVDGPSPWYFTEERVNELVDPAIKFTQEILSANPWYVIETYKDDPENPDCNGRFTYDGIMALTVEWVDSGVAGSDSGTYFKSNGSVITSHDQKIETETIQTYSEYLITTIKSVLNDDGTTDGTGTVKLWYKDRADAITYMGDEACFPEEAVVAPTVVSAANRVWMDKNLGASQVATGMYDSLAYGDLYQWGRGTDGHEKRDSSTTDVLSQTVEPGHGLFITTSFDPYDWLAITDDNRWKGVAGTNNPCPAGFRLPTATEFETEIASWDAQTAAGAFASPLKLTLAGQRVFYNGYLYGVGSRGKYWTSTIDTDSAGSSKLAYIQSDSAEIYGNDRSSAVSVRCIQD